MSYAVVKYVSFNKKEEKITVTAAESNVYPRYYSKYEYTHKDMTFEQEIEYFFVSMLEGNYQGGQKKIRDLYNDMVRIKHYARDISFSKDLALNVGYENGLNHLVAKKYAVPVILKQDFDMGSIIDAIKNYNEEAVAGYKAKEKEYADKGWIITGACSSSDVFPGWNVYQVNGSYDLLLAEHSCYEQAKLGFCNTKAGRVIRIDGSYGDLFHLLSRGCMRSLNEENYGHIFVAQAKNPELWNLFSGIEMGQLPYPGFPWEKYGFKRFNADRTGLLMEA